MRLFAHFRLVGLLTLVSRVLGLIRDMGMAALFGNGVLMDAFSVAFKIPNLARRLFGEGALTAAFLPVFIRESEQSGRAAAVQVASAVLTVLTIVLGGLVIAGELLLFGFGVAAAGSATELLIVLTAMMLPYVLLICVAAQLSAVLNGLGHFTWPALVPSVLNVVWIVALWGVTPLFASQTERIYVIAAAVVAGGVLQLGVQIPVLHRLGFRFDPAWRAAWPKVREIAAAMLPVMVGLSVTQLNTLCDSLIAWGFAQPPGLPPVMPIPGSPAWPVETGTASALYFGQRLYQFPLGVFGVALGTVMFPLLTRHAERGELHRLRDDLSLGLRLVLAIGLPASAGLVLLAEPLARLFFQYGEFDADDARQTAAMIAAYGIGVWAYCGQLIVHRAYYAVGDRSTPMRIGMAAVALNIVLNLTLIWPMGGQGLAAATALASSLQTVAVVWCLQARIGRLEWQGLARTCVKAVIATGLMSAACLFMLRHPILEGAPAGRLMTMIVPLTVSIAVYFAAARLLRMDEPWMLLRRHRT